MRVFQDIELEGIELNLREGWTTIQPGLVLGGPVRRGIVEYGRKGSWHYL